MTGSIQSNAAQLARQFRHDRVTDVHVLLAWLVSDGTPAGDSLEIAKVNLRERLKELVTDGLVEAATGPDLAITERARAYMVEIAGASDVEATFRELIARSGVDVSTIRPAGAQAAAGTGAPTARTLDECLAELDALVGLDDVKRKVKQLVAVQRLSRARQEQGQPVASAGLNLVFSGDPGTGKTTVARLLAEIYRALGLLSSGHLVEAGPSDLIAEYVGQTPVKTMAKIEEAIGGVLFIDEAYSLVEQGTGGYGREAIATLVKAMEDHRDDLAIIVAGYTEPMMRFIKANPGLQSRFARQIYFENYSSGELTTIFSAMCTEHRITASDEVMTLVKRHLDRNPTGGDNGNGRYVRKLFVQMYENLALRVASGDDIDVSAIGSFSVDDVPSTLESAPATATLEEALAELNALVGLAEVKQRITSLIQSHSARLAMDAADRPAIDTSLNLIFSGDPGTGKTTVARIVARIYRALGVLPRGHLVEVGRNDLVASYLGQTASKTTGKVDEAMGGVLFIDEAYALTAERGNLYGAEAVATLVQLMENRRGQFAVIAAGYREDMKFFVESNPGLKSRMDHEVHFPNYSPTELLEIFEKMASDKAIAITVDVRSRLLEHFSANPTGGANGNGRYVRKLFEYACGAMASRAAESDYDIEILSAFTPDDIPAALPDSTAQRRIGF